MNPMIIPVSICTFLAILSGLYFKTSHLLHTPVLWHGLLTSALFLVPGVFFFLPGISLGTLFPICQLMFLAIGCWHVYKTRSWFSHHRLEALLSTLLIGSIGTIGFVLLAHFVVTDMPFWLASAAVAFAVPYCLMQSYHLWKQLPVRIYNVWQFDAANAPLRPAATFRGERVALSLQVAKQSKSDELLSFEINAPLNMPLGELLHELVYEHNQQHADDKLITYAKDGSLCWYFYTEEHGWNGKKQPLAPHASIYRNGLSNQERIVARAVSMKDLDA